MSPLASVLSLRVVFSIAKATAARLSPRFASHFRAELPSGPLPSGPAGMGEPCLNLPSVLAAHRCLNQDVGISSRAITISTVGVPQSLRRLAEHKLQSTLAVSLHAPTQELRERLIPSAKAYPFDALLQDCRAYFEATGASHPPSSRF